MTPSRRKLREFYCSEYKWKDGSVTYTHISSKREQDFLVREVSPELDKAVERMVELFKIALQKKHPWPEIEQQTYQEWLINWITKSREALAEFERVRGK